MKKIVLLALLLAPFSAFAECDFANLRPGAEFKNLKEQFNLDELTANEKKFSVNVRGRDICDELKGTEISLMFIKNILVQTELYRKSKNHVIYNILTKNFGKPSRELNDDGSGANSFSTFWDKENFIVTYSFHYSGTKQKYIEKLVVQSKGASDAIAKFTSVDEEKQ